MPYHIETSLYSCHKNSAPIKATAVCPEGKEFFADLSGLSTLAVYFNPFTDAAINTVDNPKMIVLSLKLCFPFTPTRFNAYTLAAGTYRSEEHTSELQSRPHLVCRLLLEKKNKKKKMI